MSGSVQGLGSGSQAVPSQVTEDTAINNQDTAQAIDFFNTTLLEQLPAIANEQKIGS